MTVPERKWRREICEIAAELFQFDRDDFDFVLDCRHSLYECEQRLTATRIKNKYVPTSVQIWNEIVKSGLPA